MSAIHRALVVVLVAVAATLAACTIPTDGEPRPLADQPSSTPSSAADAAEGPQSFDIVLVESETNELVRVERGIDELPTGEVVLGTLLEGATEAESERGISTQIPPGTTAVDVTREGQGLVAVELSEEWSSLTTQSGLVAYAQVVLTLTELPGIDAVRFIVDGEAFLAPTDDEGDQRVVDASDYQSLAPA